MKQKTWRIEVATRPDLVDPAGKGVQSDIADLAIAGVRGVRFTDVIRRLHGARPVPRGR